MSVPLAAQETPPSSTSAAASPSQDAAKSQELPAAEPLNLPVSLEKIREALAQTPVEPLKGLKLEEQPHFRLEIQEWQHRIQTLLESLKFDTGPVVPGGRDAFEQQRRLFPSVDNPRVQPYAAYTQGELVQVLVTSLLERYFAGRVVHAITAAERAHAEAAARAEVSQAIAEYCAAQPNREGIQICASGSPAR